MAHLVGHHPKKQKVTVASDVSHIDASLSLFLPTFPLSKNKIFLKRKKALCYYSLVTVPHDTLIWLNDSEKLLVVLGHLKFPNPLLLIHPFPVQNQVKHDANLLPLDT